MQSRRIRPEILQQLFYAWFDSVPVVGASSSAVCHLPAPCSAATPLRRRVSFQQGTATFHRFSSVRWLCTSAGVPVEGTDNTAAAQQQPGSPTKDDNSQSGKSNPLDGIMTGSPVTCTCNF